MLIAAALIIVGAIYLMVRRVDVRLVLLGAGLAMALLAGQPLAIADTFTRGMVAAIGLADALLRLASASNALVPLSAGFPWALSILSGSGSGPILTFAQTFLTQVAPTDQPVVLGAMACLGGAFGRTMSPVSAVVVYGSGLVGAPPLVVIRHLLPALLAGGAVALGVALR